MTPSERNTVIEECAVRLEQEPHSLAGMFAEVLRGMKTVEGNEK